MQTGQHVANVGSRLKRVKVRKAPSEMPAFQPYRGKPALRNDRGDRGNVGIIRSPLRASILPDRKYEPRSKPRPASSTRLRLERRDVCLAARRHHRELVRAI